MGADVSVTQNNGLLWQPGVPLAPCTPSWSVPCPVPPSAHGEQESPSHLFSHPPASSCCLLAHLLPRVPSLSTPPGHGGSARTHPLPSLLPSLQALMAPVTLTGQACHGPGKRTLLNQECQATLAPAIFC